MNLPFTIDQFLGVFEQYNEAVWPAQVALNLLAVLVVVLALKKVTDSDRVVAAILAFFWLWIGIAYHYAFFTAINPAAWGFAALNVAQGIVFLGYGVFTQRLTFRFHPNAYGNTGLIMILYALILYPALGYSLGHVYPKAPTFGLPCPTTIFTFGMLLWTDSRVPKPLLIIPVIWSFIGFFAAVNLGVLEDIGLLVSGLLGATLIVYRDRKVARENVRPGNVS